MKRLPIAFLLVLTAALHFVVPVAATTTMLGSGYAQIYNYSGLRVGGMPGTTGWSSAFPGIPDFESNSRSISGCYLSYNTDSIRTSLRSVTDYSTRSRTIWFETSGQAVVGKSYSALMSTDGTVDGHEYVRAVFDWTTNWSYSMSSRYLRLEMWIDDGPIWAVQPGGGLHGGHVDIAFPNSLNVSFRVSAVDPNLVPEHSGVVVSLCGFGGLFLRYRKQLLNRHFLKLG